MIGVTAPIVGTTSLKNLEDLIRMFVHSLLAVLLLTTIFTIESVDVKLTDEDIKFLEEPYKPSAIQGHF